MYKLLEEAVSQMVLLKNGLLDPGRQFFLDMDNLSSFGNMTEQTEVCLCVSHVQLKVSKGGGGQSGARSIYTLHLLCFPHYRPLTPL